MITRICHATTEKASSLRSALANHGVKKARCKVMPGLVLNSVEDKASAINALIEAGAASVSGLPFTDPRTGILRRNPSSGLARLERGEN